MHTMCIAIKEMDKELHDQILRNDLVSLFVLIIFLFDECMIYWDAIQIIPQEHYNELIIILFTEPWQSFD